MKTSALTAFSTHRHTPEVAEHTGLAPKDFVFTTHLLPVERGILSTLYVWLNPARHSGRNRNALSPILRGQTDGPHSSGGPVAGIAARHAHEFLRYRICARSFGRAPGRGFLPRQSRQRRGRTSSTKHERDVGLPGNGRFAMRLVIKIAGALLESEETVQTIARQITETRTRRPRIAGDSRRRKDFHGHARAHGHQQPVRQRPARHRSRNARRRRDGLRRTAEQAPRRRNFTGRPACRGHQRVRCGLLSCGTDAAERRTRAASGSSAISPRSIWIFFGRCGAPASFPSLLASASAPTASFTTSTRTTWPPPLRNSSTPIA